MTIRQLRAALVAAPVLLLAPELLAQKSTYKPYTPPPPPPKVYTPPPRTYSPPANNNNRSPSQRPQASNNNSVRPTPRTTVTPRNPQPNRQPLTKLPQSANNNTKARAVANDNARLQQQALWKKQADQHKAQQQQMF